MAWIASAWVVGSDIAWLLSLGAPAPLRDVPGGFALGVVLWTLYVLVTSAPAALAWGATGWALDHGASWGRSAGLVITVIVTATAVTRAISGHAWILVALVLLAPIVRHLARRTVAP